MHRLICLMYIQLIQHIAQRFHLILEQFLGTRRDEDEETNL